MRLLRNQVIRVFHSYPQSLSICAEIPVSCSHQYADTPLGSQLNQVPPPRIAYTAVICSRFHTETLLDDPNNGFIGDYPNQLQEVLNSRLVSRYRLGTSVAYKCLKDSILFKSHCSQFAACVRPKYSLP